MNKKVGNQGSFIMRRGKRRGVLSRKLKV